MVRSKMQKKNRFFVAIFRCSRISVRTYVWKKKSLDAELQSLEFHLGGFLLKWKSVSYFLNLYNLYSIRNRPNSFCIVIYDEFVLGSPFLVMFISGMSWTAQHKSTIDYGAQRITGRYICRPIPLTRFNTKNTKMTFPLKRSHLRFIILAFYWS